MRYMLISRPKFAIPMEMTPAIVEGFAAWWKRYQSNWESAGFFAGGGGGGGICSVNDADALNKMMLEWPLSPFSEIEIHSLVDVDTALVQWREAMAAAGS